jgi:hypothetical protein
MSEQPMSEQPDDIKRYRVPRHLRTVGAVAAVVAIGVVAVGVMGKFSISAPPPPVETWSFLPVSKPSTTRQSTPASPAI